MALLVTPYMTGFTYEHQTAIDEGTTMAQTDGSTTKAKGKKVKAPKAKAKKNGNGSKTVTLVLDSDEAKVIAAEETVSKAQFDALQAQMAELLAKFKGLGVTEPPAVVVPVIPGEEVKMLGKVVEAIQQVEAAESVPVKPKKKYTKKPKAQPVVEPSPTDYPATIAAGAPEAGQFAEPIVKKILPVLVAEQAIDLKGTPVEPMVPQKPGPQMDTAALMKKLSETPPPSLIEGYAEKDAAATKQIPVKLSIKGQQAKVISVEQTPVEAHVDLAKDGSESKAAEQAVPVSPLAQAFSDMVLGEPKMAHPGPVTLFGGKGKGTGGDLIINPDGSIPMVPLPQVAEKLKQKVAEQVEKMIDTNLTYNKDGIPEFGLEPFVLTDGTISKAFALPGGKVIYYNPKLVNLPEHPYEPVPGELPKLVEKVPVQAKTTATVTKQFGKDSSKQEVEEETLAVHTFVTQPATVGVECGLTINLGNYESARISVSISVPCYAEERDAAYVEACKWVEERLGKQRDAIIASKNATGF